MINVNDFKSGQTINNDGNLYMGNNKGVYLYN